MNESKPGKLVDSVVEKPSKERLLKSELNFARFASFIFAPSHTAEKARVRTKIWTVGLPGTEKRTLARIQVNTVNARTLTTLDLRTFLALQKLWWDRGQDQENGSTTLQLRDVARTIRMGWGKKQYHELKASLLRLRQIPVQWRFAFKTAQGEGVIAETSTTVLSELHLLERYRVAPGTPVEDIEQGELKGVKSSFRFYPIIEENLRNGVIKPQYFELILGLRKELAIGLYTFLDVVMADKQRWERRLPALLADDLGLATNYQRPAERARRVRLAIEELQGKPISTGVLTLSVEKTVDDKDYKLVVAKNAFPKPKNAVLKRVPWHSRPKVALTESQEYLLEQIIEITGDDHSEKFFRRVVAQVPEQQVWILMSETKAARLEGHLKKTPGAYFTDLVKRRFPDVLK
jgi:hypothetical protein